MYLNYSQIAALIEQGAMKQVDPDCINAASLDVRLGREVMMEAYPSLNDVIDYRNRQPLAMKKITLSDSGIVICPGEFFLAHTIEICNFPDDLAALFRIKSSMGRIGLEHMDAGWVDPGFHGSLTLEFKNMTQHHSILLRPGDKIGQLVFLRGEAVSEEHSYRAVGNYNGATGVKQVGFKEELCKSE